MAALMELRSWIYDTFLPVVMVSGTSAAENICLCRNGLSLVDILRPYGHVTQLNVTMRVGEVSAKVPELKLRFHNASCISQPKPEVYEEYLHEVLSASAHKHHAHMENHAGIVPGQSSISGTHYNQVTPWYAEYKAEFLRMLAFGEHEMLDHPVASIWAIPADVNDPVSHLEALMQKSVLPPLMQAAPLGSEVMFPSQDREFPKHVVLLLDVAGSMDEIKSADNLAAVRKVFGEAHCSLLYINSATGERSARGASPDFFQGFQRNCIAGGGAGEPDARVTPPPTGLGACLSVADLESVSSFVRDFVSRTLMPRLEERLYRLNASITVARRGIRNRFTRLWRGAADDVVVDKPYMWHSIESQMRQLADLAFLMHQYEFAASIYRLAAQDYLSANNARWYGGAEEMIGLCCIMEPSEGQDPVKYFTRAYESYARIVGSRTARALATRSVMTSAAYQHASGRHLSCSLMLMRSHFEEENARAALLLEQAAYQLLFPKTPSIRKYAFRMVLAGLRFHSCAQKRLSLHAYRQVLGMYHGKGWRSIEEHLNDILGKQCREAGDGVHALDHFMSLLDSSHRPAATQQHYLSQFLDVVKLVQLKHDGSQALAGLCLPLINTSEINVLFSDHTCYGNEASYLTPTSTWTQLEACVSNWLDAPKQQTQDNEEFNLAVAGEEVAVEVEFKNPLLTRLHVSGVRLVCEFTPAEGGSPGPSGPTALDASPADAQQSQAQDPLIDPLSHTLRSPGGSEAPHPLAVAGPVRPKHEHLTIIDGHFVLHPGEVLVEQLRVKPLVAGWLRITGVHWILNEAVEGHIEFDVLGRKRKDPKGTRPGQRKHYPPQRRLLFKVLPAMPRMEASCQALPTTMYAGEIGRAVLNVRNCGSLPLRGLQLVLSHADVCCPSSSANMSKGLVDTLTEASDTVSLSRLPNAAINKETGDSTSLQLYRLQWVPDQEQVLQPGESLQWPLWLHPRTVGLWEMHLLLSCEPTGATSNMRYRTTRVTFQMQVLPLLTARAHLAHSVSDLHSEIIKLDLQHTEKESDDDIQVTQVTAISAGKDMGWRLSPPAPPSLAPTSSTVSPTNSSPSPLEHHTLSPSIPVLRPGKGHSMFLELLPPSRRPSRSIAQRAAEAAALALTQEKLEELAEVEATTPYPSNRVSAIVRHESNLSRMGSSRVGSFQSSVLDSSTDDEEGGAPPPPPPTLTAGQLNFFSPGVLHHFYSTWQRQLMVKVLHGGKPAELAANKSVKLEVDLIIVWRVTAPNKQDRLGLLRLKDLTSTSQLPLLKPIRMAIQSSPAANQVVVTRQLQLHSGSSTPSPVTHMKHDFRGGMCVMPLALLLRNCSSSNAVLNVEASNESSSQFDSQHSWLMSRQIVNPDLSGSPSSPSHKGLMRASTSVVTVQAGLSPCSEFVWCGRTSVAVDLLEAGDVVEVPLQVVLFRPGLYAITGCQVRSSFGAVGVTDVQHVEPFMLNIEAMS
eukprot:gene836-33567_t